MFEDLRDFDHTGGEESHEDRGQRDENDRVDPDEPERLAWCIEDRRELVHQRDHRNGEPGKPPPAAAEIRKQVLRAEETHEEPDDGDVENYEESEFHEKIGTCTAYFSNIASP